MQCWVSLVALALATGTPTAPRIVYEGPMGLRWGMSPDAVKAELEKRFTFTKEHEADRGVSVVQEYGGSFAGFETDRIELIFHEGKLLGLAVVLQVADTRPASKRWEEILERMTAKYGPPTKRSGAPPPRKKDSRSASLLHVAMEESAYQALDRKIVAGDYRPDARWTFKNKAEIIVSVSVEKPDESGNRVLQVGWAFIGPDAGAWGAAVKAATPRDY